MKLNRQEAFETMVRYLHKQGKRSYKNSGGANQSCMYRGPGGTKCAAGVLITDEQYVPEMEEKSIDMVCRSFKILTDDEGDQSFLFTAQVRLHDNLPDIEYVARMLKRAHEMAEMFKLDDTFMLELENL